MDKKRKKPMLCGEITAFLSLIFLLILSLVGTSLESARVNVGRSFADRSLQNAMESLYTEYCRPLWEDYHLFFLDYYGYHQWYCTFQPSNTIWFC